MSEARPKAKPRTKRPTKGSDASRIAERGARLATRTTDGPLMPRADALTLTPDRDTLNVTPASDNTAPAVDNGGEATAGTGVAEVAAQREDAGSGQDADAGTGGSESGTEAAQEVAGPQGTTEQGDLGEGPTQPPAEGTSPSSSRRRSNPRWPLLEPPDFSARGRLEAAGGAVSKLTLELPVPLVDRLARWERDYAVKTGKRVYRERILDAALAGVPERITDVVTMARALPSELVDAPTEVVGTRLRTGTEARLRVLKPELRAQRVRDVYLRHIYAAAIIRYLDFLDGKEPSQSE